MKTIKAKIKETIEREVEVEFDFPLYLKDEKNNRFMRISERDCDPEKTCFPYTCQVVSLGSMNNSFFTSIYGESEIAQDIEKFTPIPESDFMNALLIFKETAINSLLELAAA